MRGGSMQAMSSSRVRTTSDNGNLDFTHIRSQQEPRHSAAMAALTQENRRQVRHTQGDQTNRDGIHLGSTPTTAPNAPAVNEAST